MTKEEYTFFATIILHTLSVTQGNWQSKGSFVNLLLCNYVCLTNLMAVFHLNDEGDRQELA